MFFPKMQAISLPYCINIGSAVWPQKITDIFAFIMITLFCPRLCSNFKNKSSLCPSSRCKHPAKFHQDRTVKSSKLNIQNDFRIYNIKIVGTYSGPLTYAGSTHSRRQSPTEKNLVLLIRS